MYFFKYELLKCVTKQFGVASGAEMTHFTFKEMIAKMISSDSVCSKCLTRIPHQIRCLLHDILPEQKPWVFKLQYPVKLLKQSMVSGRSMFAFKNVVLK